MEKASNHTISEVVERKVMNQFYFSAWRMFIKRHALLIKNNTNDVIAAFKRPLTVPIYKYQQILHIQLE